ncbi:MAG: hypothetical protein ABSG13_20750 [Bryobacteraceae bacterium]|jgi:predicted RNase H-like HicB family nuclease
MTAPNASTPGHTLEEARANLKEALTMVIDANRELLEQWLERWGPNPQPPIANP